MKSERWTRVLAAFAEGLPNGDRNGAVNASVCTVACGLLRVSDLAVTLTSDQHRGRVCAGGVWAAELDDLQFTLGEGPAIDASVVATPVSEPWLARGGERWPAFARAAVEAGVGAVFAYPLRVGAARLGAMTLYQRSAGQLDRDQQADAPIVAEVVTLRVLALQADAGDSGELGDGLLGAVSHRAQVHQASGMVSAQLGVGVVDALILLRSRAFAESRALADLADDVVNRRIRFT